MGTNVFLTLHTYICICMVNTKRSGDNDQKRSGQSRHFFEGSYELNATVNILFLH